MKVNSSQRVLPADENETEDTMPATVIHSNLLPKSTEKQQNWERRTRIAAALFHELWAVGTELSSENILKMWVPKWNFTLQRQTLLGLHRLWSTWCPSMFYRHANKHPLRIINRALIGCAPIRAVGQAVVNEGLTAQCRTRPTAT